jgi:hypothetical protein
MRGATSVIARAALVVAEAGEVRVVPTTTAAMADSHVTVRAVTSTRAMNMFARNGHRARVVRFTTRWRMKSAFPARAATVIVAPHGPRVIAVPRRREIAVPRRMEIVGLRRKATVVRHRMEIAALLASIVPLVPQASIARRALKAIAVRRGLRVIAARIATTAAATVLAADGLRARSGARCA